jgi:hypothetical protein
MPKKKSKPRKTASQRRRHQGGLPHRATPAAAVTALLAELEDWARELDLFIEDSTWLVERAIELKRDHLASPDPTAWTEEEIRAVLTELFPRTVATTADEARLVTPAMTLYFSFLLSTGRFRSPLTDASLTALMEQLATEVPQALEDPARRSMGGNLVHYAIEHGVDVSDPAQLAAFMEHVNGLSYEERVAITDGAATAGGSPTAGGATTADGATAAGGPPWPGAAFGLGADAEAGGAASPFAEIWPASLGHPPDHTALSRGPFDPEEAAELFERSVLLRRARQLLEWVGDGRPVTTTGALRLSDTAEVIDLLGISVHAAPRSMWWVRELVLLWVPLVRLGYLAVGRTRVTPGEEALPGADAAPAEVATAGAGLHAAVLHAFLEAHPDRPGFALEPDLTLGALLRAAEPQGLTIPAREVDGDARPPGEDDYPVRFLGHDLANLATLGILEREGDTYRLPEALHPIVPTAVRMLTAG